VTSSPRRRSFLVATLVVVLLLAVAGGAAWALFGMRDAPAAEESIRMTVYADTAAAREAAQAPEDSPEQTAAAYLAQQPTAYWLVPEREPIGQVGPQVTALAQQASDQGATPPRSFRSRGRAVRRPVRHLDRRDRCGGPGLRDRHDHRARA
jgi:endoglucanase